jgi:hypothetical protein
MNDARAIEPMLAALKDQDVDVIAGGYRLFIEKGQEGSEGLLIKALDKYGAKEMAEDFLNCGNSLLEDAAKQWADAHGYTIRSGRGGGGPTWGSSR